jgi:hypothetical protein
MFLSEPNRKESIKIDIAQRLAVLPYFQKMIDGIIKDCKNLKV